MSFYCYCLAFFVIISCNSPKEKDLSIINKARWEIYKINKDVELEITKGKYLYEEVIDTQMYLKQSLLLDNFVKDSFMYEITFVIDSKENTYSGINNSVAHTLIYNISNETIVEIRHPESTITYLKYDEVKNNKEKYIGRLSEKFIEDTLKNWSKYYPEIKLKQDKEFYNEYIKDNEKNVNPWLVKEAKRLGFH
jgi:hypothetical protein